MTDPVEKQLLDLDTALFHLKQRLRDAWGVEEFTQSVASDDPAWQALAPMPARRGQNDGARAWRWCHRVRASAVREKHDLHGGHHIKFGINKYGAGPKSVESVLVSSQTFQTNNVWRLRFNNGLTDVTPIVPSDLSEEESAILLPSPSKASHMNR